MANMNFAPILDIEGARRHISNFACPEGFSSFAWRQLQQTALAVWHAHLSGTSYRGSLHFCRSEFYDMLIQPNGGSIVSTGGIRRFKAA